VSTSAEPARDRAARTADALAALRAPGADVWVATASADGVPYLVPLSLVWWEEQVVVALESTSPTARNLTASGRARLGVGPTRDVVMLDVVLDRSVDVGADDGLAEAFVAQADWDPRRGHGYVFLVLQPTRVQAWREANEIPGRTLMRDGTWLARSGRPVARTEN